MNINVIFLLSNFHIIIFNNILSFFFSSLALDASNLTVGLDAPVLLELPPAPSSSSLKLGSKNLHPIVLNNSSIPAAVQADVSLKTAPISFA